MTKLVKPLILVTNDDGITSPGIRMLIKQMNILGDVVVVAPNSPQSGKSHAISISEPLRCDPVDIDSGPQIEYSCSGTPADCIKLAIHEILDRRPDIIVSGVNHGSNASVNVIYSGTMAAAIEGAMQMRQPSSCEVATELLRPRNGEPANGPVVGRWLERRIRRPGVDGGC